MSNRAQRGVAADSHYVAIFGSVALIALTALFGLWLLIAVVSVFRPDSKRPNGTFESYAGLVRKVKDETSGAVCRRPTVC